MKFKILERVEDTVDPIISNFWSDWEFQSTGLKKKVIEVGEYTLEFVETMDDLFNVFIFRDVTQLWESNNLYESEVDGLIFNLNTLSVLDSYTELVSDVDLDENGLHTVEQFDNK